MISVIIPLFNKASYIEKAIRSVFNQTYQDFELIIVNDGSTDESLKNSQVVISTLQVGDLNLSKKIKVIDQKNQGVSTARNNGVKEAHSDYIAFLDADDWWEPNYLDEIKMLIIQYPGAGIYCSSYYKVKDGYKIIANIGVDSDFRVGRINYFETYSKTMWMPVWTGAVVIPRRLIVEEGGFKAQLKIGEDFDLWIRLALKYQVILLNKALSNYNQDVDYVNRAAHGKLHAKESDFLFNSDCYSQVEKENADLKNLLDKHRVMHLMPYYYYKNRKQDAIFELSKVNWTLQPFKIRLQYKQPYFLGKIIFDIRSCRGKIKLWVKGFIKKKTFYE